MPELPVPTPGSAPDSPKPPTRAGNNSHGSRSPNHRPDSQQRMSPVRAVVAPLRSLSPAHAFNSPRIHAAVTSAASSSRSFIPPHDLEAPLTPTQPHRASPFRYNLALDVPNNWGQDRLFEEVSLIDTSPVDDQYLTLIADNDWSSPSGYQSITTSSGTTTSQGTHVSGSQSNHPTSRLTNDPQTASFSSDNSASTGPATQPSASLPAPTAVPADEDLFDDLSDILFPTATHSTTAEAMPAVTRSRASEPQAAAPNKRQRNFRWLPRPESTNHSEFDSEADPFASDPFEEKLEGEEGDVPVGKNDTETLVAIDLTETNDVPEEATKREIDNRVKLGAFQCAICMDNVTSLVVTHCGHLYCAACLHQSLHVASTRGKCPMCRAKVETRPRSSYTSKTKGYWPLELKLMTSIKKGKRKADAMDNE